MNQTKQREEQLSSLLDNGLDEQHLTAFMQDLKRDPIDDAQTATRYNLIGDVMRDELNVSSFIDVSAAVHRAIEQEPELYETPQKPTKSLNVFALLGNLVGDWAKPLTGVAVAASVAMVTLVTFNGINNSDSSIDANQLVEVKPIQIQTISPAISKDIRIVSTEEDAAEDSTEFKAKHSGYMQQAKPFTDATNNPLKK